jgi:hypothetical protein
MYRQIWRLAPLRYLQRYNEGVREAGYDKNKVGEIADVFNRFIKLIKEFPWKLADD